MRAQLLNIHLFSSVYNNSFTNKFHPASHRICGVSFYIAIPIARIQALLRTASRETQSGNRVVSEYIANRTARKPTDGMEMRATATHAAQIHEKRAQK